MINGLTLGPPLKAEACDLYHSCVASDLQHITTYNRTQLSPLPNLAPDTVHLSLFLFTGLSFPS